MAAFFTYPSQHLRVRCRKKLVAQPLQRGKFSDREIFLKLRPDARQKWQIARLATNQTKPRENPKDAQGALGAQCGKGRAEPRLILARGRQKPGAAGRRGFT